MSLRAHAGFARNSRGDDHHIGARSVFVVRGAGDTRVKMLDR